MARAISWLALIVAYLATLFYLAAMCTPWWYTTYYPVNSSDSAFYDANPGLDQHTGLFDMTNCFIDGSCITGGQIYKNNSSLQWVYTATLVLMIVGWIPWLIFVHLLHFRANKNRVPMRGRRTLMAISALLAWLIILAAIIVFATGMVKTNGVYNSGGLYGHKAVVSQNGYTGIAGDLDDEGRGDKRQAASNNFGYTGLPRDQNLYFAPQPFGSLPYGNQGYTLLGSGIPLLPGVSNTTALNGSLGYKWGAHVAWYLALLPLALIPLALLLGLAIKPAQRVVTQTRTVERTVATQPAVVAAPHAVAYQQQPVVGYQHANTMNSAV